MKIIQKITQANTIIFVFNNKKQFTNICTIHLWFIFFLKVLLHLAIFLTVILFQKDIEDT